MERRAFLGAAAALAALPDLQSGDGESRVAGPAESVTEDRLSAGSMSGVWTAAELGELVDEESSVSVSGWNYDDEDPSHVMMHVTQQVVGLSLSLSPERARELAADLEAAADHAAGEDRD